MQKKNKSLKRIIINTIVIMLLSLIFAHVMADESSDSNKLEVVFKDPSRGAFSTTSVLLEKDEKGLYVLPSKFSNTVTVNVIAENIVDEETFYFDNNWQSNENAYAYSFTGWQISGTSKRLPSETVFHPGDYIDMEFLLENENSSGHITNRKIELEAIWGKTIFIKNQYNNMVYNSYVILDETASSQTGETGASDSNSGRLVSSPVATINKAYEKFSVDITNYDPYVNVIMLIGDVDYVKSDSVASKQPGYNSAYQTNYFGQGIAGKNNVSYVRSNSKSVTIKSRQLPEDRQYLLKLKGFRWYFNPIGSLVLDNVDYGLILPSEVPQYNSAITPIYGGFQSVLANKGFFDFTNRCTNTRKSGISIVGDQLENITVNGGYFSSLIINGSYVSNVKDQKRKWFIGGNAVLTGSVLMGTNNQNFTTKFNGDIELYMKRGQVGSIYGSSSPALAISGGDRKIKLIGATVNNIYGGGSSGVLYGNIDIDVIGCTLRNLYGGGNLFSATTYGNIDINISNSTITGSVYGGGYNGNVEVTPSDAPYGTVGNGGNVKIVIKNSTITGNVFGSGSGGSQNIEYSNYASYSISSGQMPANWDKPLSNYPQYNADTDRIMIDGYKQLTGGYGTTSVGTYRYQHEAYLSLATVENVEIDIISSSVNGRVYGGGSIAVVNGNTKINIKDNSTILGDIYGGGDGATKPSNVTVYKPISEDGYVAPYYTINGNYVYVGGLGSTSTTLTSYSEASIAHSAQYTLGSFAWSSDRSLIAKGGYDVERKLIYSPNTEGLGKVKGNTEVNIDNSSVKNVYAGGRSGIVEGNTLLKISENSTVTGTAYGGGQTALVNGDSNIVIDNGTVNKIYGGGENGEVSNVTFTINGGTTTTAFAGGKSAAVNGDTTILVNGGNTGTLYAGGEKGAVQNTNVTVNGGSITSALYGGGSEGNVSGDIHVTTEGGTVNKLFAGCNAADVLGNIHLFLEKGTVTTGFGGNNASGEIANDITVVIGSGDNGPNIGTLYGAGNDAPFAHNVNLTINQVSGTANNIYGGGCGSGATVSGDTTVTVNKGTFNYIFGGGNLAKVVGNTNVTVGNIDTNEMVTVNNVVYGGGRGLAEGDASGIITVEGQSNVTIAGMNTLVQNYGSTTLGGVRGDVNVYFENYRKNNSTNPYVVMNGIDRATRVELSNSYMALENLNENGEKEGIKNIDYLKVPAGSGLKVTASGAIKKDFEGGGIFYLDSMVKLKVGGNITGRTELVINPEISEDESTDAAFLIRGGIENAYLEVSGESSADNIFCSDKRYREMMRYDARGYYYLEADVPIDEQISEVLVYKKGIEYDLSNIDGWDNIEHVYIYQDGIFSANINLEYNFSVNNGDTTSYRNVHRSIYMKESDVTGSIKYFPKGTNITMIVEKENGTTADPYDYYVYTVPENTTSIPLHVFANMTNPNIVYAESHDIVSDGKSSRQGTKIDPAVYKRREQYRFVMDYSYADEFLPVESYMLYMDIADGTQTYESLELAANNLISLMETRKYGITLNMSGDKFLENSIINIGTEIHVTANPVDRNELFTGKPLKARLSILTPEGGVASLPNATKVYVDSGSDIYEAEGGVARFNLVDSITQAAYDANKTIHIDMSEVADYTMLPSSFVLQLEVFATNETATRVVDKQTLLIHIVRPEGGVLVVKVKGESPRNSAEIDELLDISTNKVKDFQISYQGDLSFPYLTVKLQKKNGSNYSDVQFNGFDKAQIADLAETTAEELHADFSGLASGTYRMVFDLYGFGDVLFQESVVKIEN